MTRLPVSHTTWTSTVRPACYLFRSIWCQSYKTFSPSPLTLRANKLECLSLQILFRPSIIFVGKDWSLPLSGATDRGFTQALLTNIRQGWKDLQELSNSSSKKSPCKFFQPSLIFMGEAGEEHNTAPLQTLLANNKHGWSCFVVKDTIAHFPEHQWRRKKFYNIVTRIVRCQTYLRPAYQ